MNIEFLFYNDVWKPYTQYVMPYDVYWEHFNNIYASKDLQHRLESIHYRINLSMLHSLIDKGE